MDYTITAKKLIEQLGGRENVASLTHCMTRLRFVLKDESSINDKLVEEIPGVMGVAKKGGQYQVIIGNNVAKCYAEINKLYPISDSASSKQKKEKRNPITVALDFISGCMTPMVAAITAGGLIKVLLVVLGPSLLNALSTTSDTYIILNAFGNAIFYFLPIFVAITASKKLGCNTYLAVLIAAVLLYPDLITLLGGDTPTRLFGFIPVIHGSYSSSVIPAMLSLYHSAEICGDPSGQDHAGMVKKLSETSADRNHYCTHYSLPARTAWSGHRRGVAIYPELDLQPCTVACNGTVCSIYAVYHYDWYALGVHSGCDPCHVESGL